jgi:hypothetical protein
MAEITVFYEGPLVTLVDARALGLKHYFTGKPCKRGHIAPRYTAHNVCTICRREYDQSASRIAKRQQRELRPEVKEARRQRERSEASKKKRRAYVRAHREASAASKARYKDSEKGKASRRKYDRRLRERRRTGLAPPLAEAKRIAKLQRIREYRQTPRGKQARLRNQARRRALKKNVPATFSEADHQKLLQTQKKCHICGKRFTQADPPTLDHVIALADGGGHVPSNVALAHRSCNSQKNACRTHLI